MTYTASEISVELGRPVELYKFVERETLVSWLLTSSASDIVHLEETYKACPGLHRGEIEDDEDAFSSELKVYLPTDEDLVSQFILATPDYDIDLILYRAHGADYKREWSGTIHACYPIDGEEAIITLKDMMGDLEKPCQYIKFCRQCSVILYSELCGVNKDLFAVAGAVDSMSGNNVTSTAFGFLADTWFNGGWIIANGRRRKIATHTGDTIVLAHQVPGLVAGMPFVAYPGCNHLYSVCVAKFNNGLDHKGFPFIVDDNPWLQRVFG